MKCLLILVAILAIVPCTISQGCKQFTDSEGEVEFENLAQTAKNDWDHFERQGHPKKEKSERKGIFQNALNEVNKHNQQNVTFCKTLNKFATLTPAELQGYLGLNRSAFTVKTKDNSDSVSTRRRRAATALPQTVDKRSWTGPVENQGSCGSCWAFGASHALTAAIYQKTNTLSTFAEQPFVDCVYSTGGCLGGSPEDAWNYLKTKATYTDAAYPYTGKSGTCKSQKGAVTSGSKYVSSSYNDEASLLTKVASVPVAIAFDVESDFYLYKSGVFDMTTSCGANHYANHEMVIVGYGTDSVGGNYWLVKNSWGASWGESGYIRVKRGKNLCSIGDWGEYPVLL